VTQNQSSEKVNLRNFELAVSLFSLWYALGRLPPKTKNQ